MKELPKYAFLTHSEIEGRKIIMLERPYLIATVYEVNKKQIEMIDTFLEDMAQERYPMAKVPGYYVFLRLHTSLEPCNDRAYQQQVLTEMAHFMLKERINDKMGLYNKFSESDKPLLERIQERDVLTGKNIRLRERRRRD